MPAADFISWDKEALREEIEKLDNGKEVNWSELARKYNVKNTVGEDARNGGQIVKEWLKSEGVDVNRFKRTNDESTDDAGTNQGRLRRKKRRTTGGEITVPTEVTQD